MNNLTMRNLVMLQDALNEYITKDWKNNRTELDFMIAGTLELAELMDSEYKDGEGHTHNVGWKWWKGSNKKRTTDTLKWDELHPKVLDNIKIELTDLLFFALSQKRLNDLYDEEEVLLVDNDWLNLMSINAALLLQYPGRAIQIILKLSKKLNFNIATYYIAKHHLNVFRQSNGYKNNSYKKIENGMEDNEHLHSLIKDITYEELSNDFEKTFDKIADRFYDSFGVVEDKKYFTFWNQIIDRKKV